jgi:hypothetical protein
MITQTDNRSEIAQLRQAIAEEQEAAERALRDYAMVDATLLLMPDNNVLENTLKRWLALSAPKKRPS